MDIDLPSHMVLVSSLDRTSGSQFRAIWKFDHEILGSRSRVEGVFSSDGPKYHVVLVLYRFVNHTKKLTKTALGLSWNCRTKPLLIVLNMLSIWSKIANAELCLFQNCILSTSISRRFYLNMQDTPHTLPNRVSKTLQSMGSTKCKYLINSSSRQQTGKVLKTIQPNGISDSIKALLFCYNDENRFLTTLLLKPYWLLICYFMLLILLCFRNPIVSVFLRCIMNKWNEIVCNGLNDAASS